jgi:hypothetical protein
VRGIAHTTLSTSAVPYPSSYLVFDSLQALAATLPQVLTQTARLVGQQLASGHVVIEYGECSGRPNSCSPASAGRSRRWGSLPTPGPTRTSNPGQLSPGGRTTSVSLVPNRNPTVIRYGTFAIGSPPVPRSTRPSSQRSFQDTVTNTWVRAGIVNVASPSAPTDTDRRSQCCAVADRQLRRRGVGAVFQQGALHASLCLRQSQE